MPKVAAIFSLLAALLLAACTPQQDETTYLSLGDSLAAGVGASDPSETGYAPLYRDALAREAGREVRLVQLGVGGETSASLVGGYPDGDSQLVRAEEVLREAPGAVATLSVGGNDLLRVADAPDAEREAAVARLGRNVDLILGTLRGASEPAPRVTVLALYDPLPGSPSGSWVERANAEIRRVAREHGTRVAAADRAFRGREAELLSPDGIHPNDAGHRALAEAAARTQGPPG